MLTLSRMAYVEMLPLLLILLFNRISYIGGKVNDKKSLKFTVVPPDDVKFVRGNEHNTCNERKITQSKTKPLHCVVNQESNITWQVCHSFNGDQYSKNNFLSCYELFQNEGKYCRNMSRKRDSNYAVVTIGMLVEHATEEPHTGCFRCIAQVGNQKVEASGEYTYIDQCGTPTRYEAINPLKLCLRKNNLLCQSKEKECRMLPPEDVRVIQNLTTEGNADIILEWKEAKSTSYVAGVYGYQINFIDDSGWYHCVHLITKYNKTAWFKDEKYHFSIKDNFGYRYYMDSKSYGFTLQSLPTSKIVKKTIKMNFAELCENYTKTYKHTPTKCLMVTDIKLVSCIPQTSATLSWNTTWLPSTVSKIQIWYFAIGTRLYQLSPNATSFTFKNVTKGSTVLIRLKVGRQYTYCSRVIRLASKAVDRLHANVENGKESKGTKYVEDCGNDSRNEGDAGFIDTIDEMKDPIVPDREPGRHDYTKIALITLFSVCTLIIIVILAVNRIDKCSLSSLSIQYYNPFSTTSSVVNEKQEATKVMMVYPKGCAEVEDLIDFLGTLLRGLGIDVSVDIFEEERVATDGARNKLVNDFIAANYVVVLCVGSQGKKDTDVVHSENYDFVMNPLLLPACSDDNGKRFIAVSLSKCRKTCNVPPYLMERSYVLSSDLEFFLQHILHDIQTTCSSNVFIKACRIQVENIDDIKKEFQSMGKKIQAETHKRCYPRYCCKGTKESASQYSSEVSLTEERLDESRNSCVSLNEERVVYNYDGCNSSERLLK